MGNIWENEGGRGQAGRWMRQLHEGIYGRDGAYSFDMLGSMTKPK